MLASVLVTAALAAGQVQGVAEVPPQPPLETALEALQRASNSLSHAANQTCDVQKARATIKAAIKDVQDAATFSAAHTDALKLPPLPADVAPDFTAPPRPAPQRNAMLEGALKSLETAFHRLEDAPGADLGGFRDAAYRHVDEAARDLAAAIKTANAAFRAGRRDLPDCDPRPSGG
jgi:hypothetical protein